MWGWTAADLDFCTRLGSIGVYLPGWSGGSSDGRGELVDASKEQLVRLGDLAVQVSDNRDTMTMADGALFARVRYVGRVLQSGTRMPEGLAREARLEIAMWVQAMRDLADAAVSVSAGLTVLFDMETANSQKEARDLLRKARENVKACRLGVVSPDPNRDLGDPVA